jgi:PPOX class probable F420-dependent enzyme
VKGLENARYLSLVTFRRDGREVATPVWFAEAEDRLYAFSAGDAGKVKRLRNSPRAKVARCDMRGGLQGDWLEASAHIVADEATVARAYRALRAKYGWQMALADAGSRLTGRYRTRAMLEIEVQA